MWLPWEYCSRDGRHLIAALAAGLVIMLTVVPAAASQAPALNAPTQLPLDSADYGASGFRIGVLLQVRADFYEGDDRTNTFFLRKAELAVQGHVADHTDFSLELDPVNPDDPLRRTYIRLSHLERFHLKVGMEKAPLGLEELLSTPRLPFVERSEVNDRFAQAEEVGLHLESRWDHWLFQLSLTNGGRRLLKDDNKDKDVSVRAVWAPLPWMSLGVAALQGRTGEDRSERDRYNLELKLGSDESGLQGELYRAKDRDLWSSALYVASFHAFPMEWTWLTHLQPALRYERVDRGDDLEEEELNLLTIGVGAWLDGHRSKLEADYLVDLRPDSNEGGLRLQYQVDF